MKTEIRFYFEHPSDHIGAIQEKAKTLFSDLLEFGVTIEESVVESREDLDLLNSDWEDGPSPSI